LVPVAVQAELQGEVTVLVMDIVPSVAILMHPCPASFKLLSTTRGPVRNTFREGRMAAGTSPAAVEKLTLSEGQLNVCDHVRET
jgi:hypothetical protein